MATPVVKLKRSAVGGAIPTTGQLALGEVAINTFDGKLFIKKDNGTESIVEIGNGGGSSGVSSIIAGTGISVDQSTGDVTVSATTTDHKILDNISSSFDGSTTQFTVSSSSTNFLNSEITSAARLLISVGGTVQAPDPSQTNGYYISGGTDLLTDPIKINFVEAPKAGQIFFGVAYGLTTSPSESFVTKEQSIAYSIMFGV
jgi:hypothetical protein